SARRGARNCSLTSAVCRAFWPRPWKIYAAWTELAVHWRKKSITSCTEPSPNVGQYSQSSYLVSHALHPRDRGGVLYAARLAQPARAEPHRHRDLRVRGHHRLVRRLAGAPARPDLGLPRLP